MESVLPVRKVSTQCGKFPHSMECFQTSRKVSTKPAKFPDGLESFEPVWKVSSQSRNFSHSLRSFYTVRKVSTESGKFAHSLESFHLVWKVSSSVKSFQTLVNFRTVLKVFRQCQKFPSMCPMIIMTCKQKQFMHFGHMSVAKATYTLLVLFCRKNDLRRGVRSHVQCG